MIPPAPVSQQCHLFCDPMDCSTPGSWSMGFPRQEYWSVLPFTSLRDLPDPGMETSPASPALQAEPAEPHPEKPQLYTLQECSIRCLFQRGRRNICHRARTRKTRWMKRLRCGPRKRVHNNSTEVTREDQLLDQPQAGAEDPPVDTTTSQAAADTTEPGKYSGTIPLLRNNLAESCGALMPARFAESP
ncbi:uncharacterized protein LOC129542117 isoform X2 [Moschus berezovskii]|nr:uncharacterized protein LOC129542117 isoform X2 [Moschus berezovskii]